ncbi:MAG: hypothetical protein QW267_07015 [Sulfolobales archaeon]
MHSLVNDELIARIVKSLRVFNFFIFQRTLYPEVVNLLKSANVVRLVRISELDGGRTYYILEPDTAICDHKCASKCSSEGNFKSKCYVECISSCKSSIVEAVVSGLDSIYKNSSQSV